LFGLIIRRQYAFEESTFAYVSMRPYDEDYGVLPSTPFAIRPPCQSIVEIIPVDYSRIFLRRETDASFRMHVACAYDKKAGWVDEATIKIEFAFFGGYEDKFYNLRYDEPNYHCVKTNYDVDMDDTSGKITFGKTTERFCTLPYDDDDFECISSCSTPDRMVLLVYEEQRTKFRFFSTKFFDCELVCSVSDQFQI